MADERGIARVSDLPPGEHTVSTASPGLLPGSATVVVKADKTTEAVLMEPGGGRLDVEVVDPSGKPRPFARLLVRAPSGRTVIDEVQGRQRLDMFTDERGHRRFERIESGALRVRAFWGGHAGDAQVELEDGGFASVRVVVPDP